MAQDKNSFLLYADMIELFETLEDDQAGKLIKHIFKYVNDQDPDLQDPILKIAFISIKQALKRDLKKYEKLKEEKSNAGIVGNLKRWHHDLYEKYKSDKISLAKAIDIAEHRKTSQSDDSDKTKSHPVPNIAVSVSESVSESDSVNVSVSESDIKRNSKGEIKNFDQPINKTILHVKEKYNKLRGNLPECKILSEKRKKTLQARIKEHGVETVNEMLHEMNQNDFLQGENKEAWVANFDWIFNKTNFIKIIEGNYKNRSNGKPKHTNNQEPTIGRQSHDTIKSNTEGWHIE